MFARAQQGIRWALSEVGALEGTELWINTMHISARAFLLLVSIYERETGLPKCTWK